MAGAKKLSKNLGATSKFRCQ